MPESPGGQERMPQTEQSRTEQSQAEKRRDPEPVDATGDTYAADEEQLVAQRLRELGYIE